MSVITSGISATPKLKQFLEESQQGQHKQVALLRVQIRGEDLVETARLNGPSTGDLSQLEQYLGNDPAFFLLRASVSSWYVITWMPEGKVGVSNRMVYASSQSNLKQAVGVDFVADALQFETVDEVFGRDNDAVGAPEPPREAAPLAKPAPPKPAAFLKPALRTPPPPTQEDVSVLVVASAENLSEQQQQQQQQAQRLVIQKAAPPPVVAPKPLVQSQSFGQKSGVFVKKIDPRTAMSKSELVHVDLLQQEDDARSEQLEQMRTRLRNHTEASKPEVNPDNHHANSRGQKQTVAAASGGFHTVTLPLSPEAKSTLSDFGSNVGTTVVELQVEANKCISHVHSYASTEEFSPNPSEPRFYIMRTPGSRVFVYSCPETSPPRLRMVYSTASAATLAQIQELGCRITHRLSLFAPKECTLIAVAATIRNGQAQRVDTDKSVDLVVNYLPSTPARSLPSRFAANTTKALDAFTDEDGFRKAFTGVRPDAPAPAPFANKAPKPVLSSASSFMRTQSPQVVNNDDGVDTSPNTGAAAWGVQLKSGPKGVAVPRVSFSNPSLSQTPAVSGSITTTTTTTYTTSFASSSSLVNRADVPRSDSFGSSKSFVQFRLAGETGDETPLSGNSTSTSNSNSKAATPEIMHSSIPGLRRVTNAGLTDNTDNKTKPNSTTSTTTGGSWDPWRSVSTVTSFKSGPPMQQQQQSVPESALQSSVFVRNDDTDSSSILAFMSDITYPPLQSNTRQ